VLQKLIVVIGGMFFLILSGNAVEGTSIVMNLKSAMLVLVGTILSALLAFPMRTFKDLAKSLFAVFKKDETDYEALVSELEKLALIWRRHGNLALEKAGKLVENVFLHKGIELVVDGYDRYDIRNMLEKDFELYFSRKESQVSVLNTLAKLAPVFGFVGTIIGLIDVLRVMEDPTQIGRGMSLALLTTFYGILFANLIFLPLSKKLSEHIKVEATVLNVILEGIMDISDQKNSKSISYRLNSYLGVNRLSQMNKQLGDEHAQRPGPGIQPQKLWSKARGLYGRTRMGSAKETA
jgi:chemotaxis protein MotA